MSIPHAGELAALGTAACWTVTSMAFESAGRRIGSLAVNLIRLILAILFLSCFTWIYRGLPFPTDASLHAWIWLAVSGWIGFNIGDLCLFRAFVVIGSRISMLVMSLVPPITAVIGWALMGEHLSPLDWSGMALTVGGVAWVVLERRSNGGSSGDRLPVTGVLLALGGAFGQALGLVLSKYGMGGNYDPFAATQIRVLAGTVGFAALYSFIGWWPRVGEALRNRGGILRTLLGSWFGPFLGVSLSLVAVKNTESGIAATIMALVPVLIIPPTVLIFKQRVSARALIGSVVAVAGVVLLFL